MREKLGSDREEDRKECFIKHLWEVKMPSFGKSPTATNPIVEGDYYQEPHNAGGF